MEISQRLLGMLFVWAVALGFALGSVYDVLRITRILCGVHYVKRFSEEKGSATDVSSLRQRVSRIQRAILVFSGDLLFGVVCGISLIILLYYTNDGQFRALAVFGTACGFFVYYHTLGRLVMLFSEVIVHAVRWLARRIVKLALWPFRMIARLLYRTVGRRAVELVKRIRYKRNVRYTAKTVEACVRLASQGFGLPSTRTDDVQYEIQPP